MGVATWSGTPTDWFVGLLDAVGSQPLGARVRQCPNPGHGGDTHPSLSVSTRDNGGARLHCFAGCPEQDVLRALGVGVRQLYQAPSIPPQQFAAAARLRPDFPPLAQRVGHPAARGYRLESVHTYAPADGTSDRIDSHLLMRWRHPTSEGKELMWETRLRAGTSIPGLLGIAEQTLPLYREDEVRIARCLDEVVAVVESESSVDALKGWYATTWAGGAYDVNTSRLTRVLGDHSYTILVPDFDKAGLACLRQMLAAGLGPAVLLGEPGEDARDLYQRLGPDRFAHAVDHALHAVQPGRGGAVTVAVGDRLVDTPLDALNQLANDIGKAVKAAPPARRATVARPGRPPSRVTAVSSMLAKVPAPSQPRPPGRRP